MKVFLYDFLCLFEYQMHVMKINVYHKRGIFLIFACICVKYIYCNSGNSLISVVTFVSFIIFFSLTSHWGRVGIPLNQFNPTSCLMCLSRVKKCGHKFVFVLYDLLHVHFLFYSGKNSFILLILFIWCDLNLSQRAGLLLDALCRPLDLKILSVFLVVGTGTWRDFLYAIIPIH